MARLSIPVLVLVSFLQTGYSQDVGDGCPIVDVRKELMELVVDHNTQLTNLISITTKSESCQPAVISPCTADIGSILHELPTIEEPDDTSSDTTTTDVLLDGAIDCVDIKERGVTVTGVYNVTLGGSILTRVYCDMDTDGGGWTVFQRRINGAVDFFRDWNDYKVGFGNMTNEFWLGNDNIYKLTALGDTEMRIDLKDLENNTIYADYASFWIGNEATSYTLHVSGYSGISGKDSLAYHNGSAFTTKDEDHDEYVYNCAVVYTGAWWYRTCHNSNLNGQYLSGNTTVYAKGVTWAKWKGQKYSLKETKMMARRIASDQDER